MIYVYIDLFLYLYFILYQKIFSEKKRIVMNKTEKKDGTLSGTISNGHLASPTGNRVLDEHQ